MVGTYIPFVIKTKPADFQTLIIRHTSKIPNSIIFKTADLTWVAYNLFGSWNLYRGNHTYSVDSRATKASYNRPFLNRLSKPYGQHENFLFGSEYPMIRWLERLGFNVYYLSCHDIEVYDRLNLLRHFQVMLSVGHDEYWTPAMRHAYTRARNDGVHLGFFSGNEIFWRVLWEEKKHGIVENVYDNHGSNRSIVSKPNDVSPYVIGGNWKHINLYAYLYSTNSTYSSILHTFSRESDEPRIVICQKHSIENNKPASSHSWTGTFMDPRHRAPEPENMLTGQRFLVNGFSADAMEVRKADGKLRLWRNTHVYKKIL